MNSTDLPLPTQPRHLTVLDLTPIRLALLPIQQQVHHLWLSQCQLLLMLVDMLLVLLAN